MSGTDPNAESPLSTPAGSGVHAVAAGLHPVIPPPTEKAKPSLISWMALARFGGTFAYSTPLIAGLALRAQDVVGPEQAVGALGLVTTVGALAAFLANPIFGRISDRTTGRFGRRRPWMIIGSVGLLIGLILTAIAPSVAVMAVGWFVAQLFINAALAAHVATVPDQIPPSQRGMVSALLGITQNVAVLGAAYATRFFSEQTLLLFFVPGVIGLILMTVYAIVLPDKQLTQRPPSEGGLLTILKTFWVNPVRNPDFGWAWISRFLLVLGNFMFVTYRLLYLQKELSLDRPGAAAVLSTGVLVYTVALIFSSFLAGWASDKLGRRKVFIVSSALVFGVGTYLLTHASTPGGFYVAELVLGLGFGVYVGVDLALVIDVLPNPDEAAKDLGVFNIALALPQALAPALGAILIGVGAGGNYDLMLTMATVCGVVGAAAIIPVKGVR